MHIRKVWQTDKVKQLATENINGINISYNDNSTDMGVIKEIFFEDPYKVRDIPNNSIVIDIGGHIGTFSIRCANEKNCTVYVYEPCEESYRLLIHNININKLYDKIKAFNKAVSDDNIVRDFYVDTYHYSGSSFYLKDFAEQKTFTRPYHIVKVECVTLKQIFDDNNIIHCNILKLDCELEEKRILLDEKSTMSLEKVDKIIIEHHCISDGKDIAMYLESKGFSVSSNNQFQAHGGILHATRPQ